MNNVTIASSISYCAHVGVGITENFLIDDIILSIPHYISSQQLLPYSVHVSSLSC